MAAAVGALMRESTSKPAIFAASKVACFVLFVAHIICGVHSCGREAHVTCLCKVLKHAGTLITAPEILFFK